MRFEECKEGEYKIFVGALDAPRGDGYIAAVVVNRVKLDQQRLREVQREVWRDDSLACGYRWKSAEEAIGYALQRAREMVKSRSPQFSYA
jgi:hypothetical protein